jgi:thiol-disulfide isomerase/thioredoxin
MISAKNLLLASLVCLGLTAPALGQTLTYNFYNGTYRELLAKARKENKPFFLYFYTNWCMPCRKMNQEAFRNKELVTYGSQNYLGMMLDAEASVSEGKQLAKFYNVYFFPMFIICTPQGKVMERLDGHQTPQQMLAALQRNQKFQGEPTGQYLYLNDDPPMSGTPTPVGKGLYRFHFEMQPSEGYGVQVGVYENYDGLLKKADSLQRNFHRNLLINVGELKGKSVYKLILGPFNSRRAAATYAENLKSKEGLEGVVVFLTEMK